MVLQKRRHNERVILASGASELTAITAAALLILVLIAFLTVLAPPILHHPTFLKPPNQTQRTRHSSALLEKPVHPKRSVLREEMFRLPSGGDDAGRNLWESRQSKHFYGCSNASKEFERADAITYPNRYLMIATSGGLNQQRIGITDAVVAARILKATLVVPSLDQQSFWKDASNFAEIFDVDQFISSLSKDVRIIKELPKMGEEVVASPYRMRVPRKCTPSCYKNRVLPALQKRQVVQLTKFDYRVSNELEKDLQKLRCRVNYHALIFTDPIRKMGEILTQRMKSKSKNFIALHLRFEPDMLAFSGCYYGGGDKERMELGDIRKRWKTLHVQVGDPDKKRRAGKCPLTPEETGLMLRALGFGREVHIYVASGEIYGGEEALEPLKALFPNFHSKETLANKEELAPFSPFSSRMAALDYIVCDGSDVFATNNNGNMAKMLAGRRKYFGHKRTIRPNAKKLNPLFLNRAGTTWETLASNIRSFQRAFMGEANEVEPGKGEFHENPSSCICEAAGDPGSSSHTEASAGLQTRERSFGGRTGLSDAEQQSWAGFIHGSALLLPSGSDAPHSSQEYENPEEFSTD